MHRETKSANVNNFSDVSESGIRKDTSAKVAKLGETYMYKVYRGSGEGYTGGAVDVHAGPKDGMIRTKEDMVWVQAMIDSGYSFGGMKDDCQRPALVW